jgi:hypothetical protein
MGGCRLALAAPNRGDSGLSGFEVAFRCGGLWNQDLEHTSGNANDALIVAHANAELDGGSVGAPSGRWGVAVEVSLAEWVSLAARQAIRCGLMANLGIPNGQICLVVRD